MENAKLERHLAKPYALLHKISTFIYMLAFNPCNAHDRFII